MNIPREGTQQRSPRLFRQSLLLTAMPSSLHQQWFLSSSSSVHAAFARLSAAEVTMPSAASTPTFHHFFPISPRRHAPDCRPEPNSRRDTPTQNISQPSPTDTHYWIRLPPLFHASSFEESSHERHATARHHHDTHEAACATTPTFHVARCRVSSPRRLGQPDTASRL